MNILFFDTCYEWIIVEVYTYNGSLASQIYRYAERHPKESSYRLITDIANSLEKTCLEKPDIILTCNGPGSFTGLRVCVSCARNFSQIWKVPVVGIDSLELYSMYYYEKYQKESLVIMDAKRKKVYSGLYDGTKFHGSFDTSPEQVYSLYPNRLEGYQIVTDTIVEKPYMNIYEELPSAATYIKRSIDQNSFLYTEEKSYKTLVPNYLRPSYAEDNG